MGGAYVSCFLLSFARAARLSFDSWISLQLFGPIAYFFSPQI
jgi:hypothetical protein